MGFLALVIITVFFRGFWNIFLSFGSPCNLSGQIYVILAGVIVSMGRDLNARWAINNYNFVKGFVKPLTTQPVLSCLLKQTIIKTILFNPSYFYEIVKQ